MLSEQEQKALSLVKYRLLGLQVGDKLRVLENTPYNAVVFKDDIITVTQITSIVSHRFYYHLDKDKKPFRVWWGSLEDFSNYFELLPKTD